MNNMIWIIVAMKLFAICWLIYILLERRKRKRGQTQNVIIIEEGPVATYAGAPVTQIPKNCQEYYSEQLYASVNMMTPNAASNMPQQTYYSNQSQQTQMVMASK